MDKTTPNTTARNSRNNRSVHDTHIRRIAIIGVMAALAIILMNIRFAPLPAAPFLEYDLGDIPILLLTLIAGPLAALPALLIFTLIEMVTISKAGFWGLFMHFLATGVMVLVLSAVTRRAKTLPRVIIGMILATVALIAVMLPLNIIIQPLFNPGLTRGQVVGMLVPILLPFNALKGGLHTVIVAILFKAITPLIGRKRL